MNWLFVKEITVAIILGIVQGITEFLPISSTAHILLFSKLLSSRDIGLDSSNIIQMGTLLAILFYFKKDLAEIFESLTDLLIHPKKWLVFFQTLISWFRKEEVKNSNYLLIWQLIIGTFPIVFMALLLKDLVQKLRVDIIWIALFLILGSMLMLLADRWSKNHQKHGVELTFLEVILIGFFQSLAIFPGISRSGATISGALLLGRNRAFSVRFSFLLSIPALALSSLDAFLEIIKNWQNITLLPEISNWQTVNLNLSWLSLFLAFLFSGLSGVISLKWLLHFLAKHSTLVFVLYRIFLAITIIFLYN